jgi:uncharacterized protein (TIGR03086 family)
VTNRPQPNGNPIELLRQANAVIVDLLGNVTPEQMTLPTVNDEWDVRELINHLVRGNAWTIENLRTGGAPRPTEDLIGDRSPLAAYTDSAQSMLAAFEEPGALGRTVQMPFGEMPGAALAMMRLSDLVSHAWDLAQATGQNTDIAPELCEIALTMSRERLDRLDRAQTPFKSEVPVPASASAADRLAAYLGKQI